MKSIFISSTFRDFHKERDLLKNHIIPAVNETAKEYGEFLSICDLRWGVDTSDDSDPESKVLTVCLDEIDRSRPYMMVFLGERYGYVPGGEYISKEVSKRGLELEDLEISVTQLEIEYGAFYNKETMNHTWFYFRELEKKTDEDSMSLQEQEYYKKLKALKQRIIKLAGERVQFYSVGENTEASYETFCQMIQDNLIKDLMGEWESFARMSPYEKDNHHQWSYLREKAGHFYAGESFAREMIQKITEQACGDSIYVLTGKTGAGKSTYFSHVCVCLEKMGWDVIPVLCGNTVMSTDEMAILRSVIWNMEEKMGLPHIEEKEDETGQEKEEYKSEVHKLQERLNALCAEFGKTGRRLLLAVDAVDQLFGVQDIRNLCFLPQIKEKNIKILLTTPEEGVKIKDARVFKIPELNQEDKQGVLEKVLWDNGKQLSSVVTRTLFKKEDSTNPLFLYLAVNHLCLMDEEDYEWIGKYSDFMEGTNHRQLHIIEQFPNGLALMAAETLRKTARMIGNQGIERSLWYISIARRGLRTADLEAILEKEGLKFCQLDFSRLIHSMNELYTLRMDGRYDYLHKTLREGFCIFIENPKTIHKQIGLHLLSLPEEDPIRQQELCYHLIHGGLEAELLSLVAKAADSHIQGKQYLSEEIYHRCMEDGGIWILKLVEDYLYHESLSSDLLSFLYYFETELHSCFLENKDSTKIYHRILSDVVRMLEEADLTRLDGNHGAHILCLGYDQIGEILERLDTPETVVHAGHYYEQVIFLREKLFQMAPGPFTAMELALAYQKMGDWTKDYGNHEQHEQTLSLYETAFKLMYNVLSVDRSENYVRNYGLICSRIGSVHQDKDSYQELNMALQFYRKSESIVRGLIEKYNRNNYRLDLYRLLCKIGSVYIRLETNENIERALALYEDAAGLIQQVYEMKYTGSSIDKMIDIQKRIGFAYAQCNEQNALINAFASYVKAYRLAEESALQCGHTANYRDMILSCHGISTVSVKLAESAYLEKALEYAHKAVEYSRFLLEENDTLKNIFFMSKSLRQEGEVYEAIGTEEALKKADFLYQESIQWMEWLEKEEYSSLDVVDEYVGLYEQIGHIYEKAGGLLHYKKALSYYKKALEQTESIMKTYGESPDRKRDIEISCNKVGNMYLQMREPEALDQAEFYIKRALGIAAELAEKYELDKYQWDYSFCCNLYGTLLMRQEAEASEVQEYFKKAFQIRKELNDRQNTLASKKSLSVSYEKLIMGYSYANRFTDAVKAASFAEKQCLLCTEIMEQEGTSESKMNLAAAYEDAAGRYFVLGNSEIQYLHRAEDYYQKCLACWEEIIDEIRTYRAYLKNIQACGGMAQFYLRVMETVKAEQYFDKMEQLAKKFLAENQEEEYKTLLTDLYMQIAGIYEADQTMDHRERCLDLYQKALGVYEDWDFPQDDYKYVSNKASILFSIGNVLMQLKRLEEAADYFEQNNRVIEQIPKEYISQRMKMNHYDSYARIAVINRVLGKTDVAVTYFSKAISMEEKMLAEMDDSNDVVEVMDDLRRDSLSLAKLYQETEKNEEAARCYDKAIRMLLQLEKAFPDAYEEQIITLCMQQIDWRMAAGQDVKQTWTYLEILLNFMHKYPEFQDYFKELEEQFGLKIIPNDTVEKKEEKEESLEPLMELFTLGEYYLTHQQEKLGIKTLEKFLNEAEKIPMEAKNDQMLIYEYSVYNHLASYTVNKNTKKAYKEAVEYYFKGVQKELDLLELIGEDRKEEVMNDIYEDCSHAAAVCMKIKKHQEANEFYNLGFQILLSLASEYSEEYEIPLARFGMEYIAFKGSVLQDYEEMPEMIAIVGTMCERHEELADLKKVIRDLMRMLKGE